MKTIYLITLSLVITTFGIAYGTAPETVNTGLTQMNQKITGSNPANRCNIHVTPNRSTIWDVVQVAAGQEWSNGCVPVFDDYHLANNQIVLNFKLAGLYGNTCTTALEEWGQTIELDLPSAGIYTATAQIDSTSCATTNFTVTSASKYYLPIVVNPQPLAPAIVSGALTNRRNEMNRVPENLIHPTVKAKLTS